MLCKICDIRDKQTAEWCAKLGADYIGLHAIWQIKHKRLTVYREIIQGLQYFYPTTKTVLVTRQQDISEVSKMVNLMKPSCIQLHAPWSKVSVANLRHEMSIRNLDNVKIIGVIAFPEDNLEKVFDIHNIVDFLLIDNKHYTSSVSYGNVDFTQFDNVKRIAKNVPVILAGGLTPENVRDKILTFKPDGVDVQTGVERFSKKGVKSFKRIKFFIQAAKLPY